MLVLEIFLSPLNTGMNTLVAPYFYSWGCGNPAYKVQSLVDAKGKMGLSAATIAFVISGGTGRVNPEIALITPDIVAFQKMGGKVILSFGGANGPYLEEAVKTAPELFSIWEKLIMSTGVKAFDFDVEGFYLNAAHLNTLRRDALRLLQAKYPDVRVSFTLAVMPPDQWGNASLPGDGVKFLQDHISAGVNINLVNCMTMDYGSSFAVKNQAQLAIACAESLKGQLLKLYPKKTNEELYAMIGITPMIGKNDDANVFQLEDAVTVSRYAKEKRIGLLSYWALQRDQCGTGSLALFSQTNKKDFDYYHAFCDSTLLPPKPGPSPNPAPKPISGPVPLKPVILEPVPSDPRQWVVGVAYKLGDVVILNGTKYVCTTSHTSQADWSPTVPTALWKS